MRGTSALGIGAFIVLTSSTASAQVTLQNDGFTDGAQVGFQAGFVAGEIGASRFVAPEAGRQLQTVQLLFGGASGTRTVTLHVWDDTSGATTPGTELFSGDFDVTASNEAIQEFDLTSDSVIVTAQFRVGIELQAAGLPSIARDDDGTINGSHNYIKIDSGTWYQSSALGLTGDWIIRAVIDDGGTSTLDAAPSDTPDAALSDGGECDGSSDCPVGEYCDTANAACTFDCREDTDCGDGTCNSLGQCVDGSGGGGGCSSGGGGTGLPGGAALLLALGALILGAGRRRA